MQRSIVYIFFLAVTFFSNLSARGQSVEVSINRNGILIGEQISFGLKIKLPSLQYKANFSIPDSITHFDIIRKGEIKGVKGENALEQILVFTSFDSGSWYFPAIPVIVSNGTGRATLYSDSFLVKVGYSPADSTNQLRDIKKVMDVHIPDYTIYFILAGILLALLLGYLIYRYIKKRKNRPKPLFISDKSAYEEAMNSLQQLEQGNLLNPPGVKEFHTRLADTFKRYYSRTNQRDLLNKTTGDLLVGLKNDGSGAETISMIAKGLRYTDAVKFAKFLPLPGESMEALNAIREGIKHIENRSPLKT